ncbi:unnamed protein product [Schistosoma bovis]|nr:unnamed protein product [Schistosoma bovis]
MLVVVVLHVSVWCSRTISKFVLNILTLMLAYREVFRVPYVLQPCECCPCSANPILYVCIRSSTFIDGDADQVLGITVLQFAITFGGTNLFILVRQVSELIKNHVVILWISCAIYLVLQTIWMYVPALARKYPYNVMYLILMTLFSTIAIASDSALYFEDIVYFMFAVSVTFINLIVCTIIVLQYDFSKHYTINLFVTLSIDLILTIGQILYFTRNKDNIVLVIAGAITFPLTVFKLLFEMKMVFGGGTFRYHQMDLVLAAGILYNCWWNLFLTLMWLSSMTGLRNLNSTSTTTTTTTSTTLLNVQSSIHLIVLTKFD